MSAEDKTPAISNTTQSKQIFISYSRSDRLAVDSLVRELRGRHYVLWMDVDKHGIEPGEEWRRELKRQLSASEAVIACVSPDFLRSPYCREEIEQAKQEKKPIFPVLVRRLDKDQSLADMGLDHLQFVDLTQGYEKGVQSLTHVIPRPRFPARLVGQRVALAVLAVLVIAGVALGGMAIVQQAVKGLEPTVTPPPPTPTPHVSDYDLGVAVAKFALEDATINAADADELIAQFSRLLESELNESMSQLRLTIGVIGPNETGRIEGDTVSERRDNARTLARSRGADIVVYGVMTRSAVTGQVEIEPEYYVVPDHFTDAQEMTGSFRFGNEIRIDDPIAQALAAEGTLSSRTTALAHVVTGLVKYVLAEDYAGALESFESAASVPDWEEQEGREVLHILLGNARMKLAQAAAFRCERDAVLENVEQATSEYEQARALADDYSRAYIGLAAASYLQALWRPEENEGCTQTAAVDLTLLQQTLDYVEQAKDADDQPDEVGVESKMLLTEAQALYWQWSTVGEFSDEEYETLYDDFMNVTNRIINNYEEGDNRSVAPLVIEAYSFRGFMQQLNGDCRAALDEYANALEIPGIPSTRRMFFTGWQGDCYVELGQIPQAVQAYETALEIADALNSEADSAFYESLLSALNDVEATEESAAVFYTRG